MEYTVDFEEYGTKIEITQECEDFGTALAVQTMLSNIAEQKKWTRHVSAKSIHRHMDTIFDLYNEGAIIVKPK